MIFNKKAPHPTSPLLQEQKFPKNMNMKIKKVKKYNPRPSPPSTIKAL
jgi:hypothetical protein